MLRNSLLGIAVVLGLLASAAGLMLYAAHRQIAALAPTLPLVASALANDASSDLPIRAGWINTAAQAMPRAAVLEPSLDPAPDQHYVMSHPAFVLEWADGKLFLFDVGMTPDQANAFGNLLEIAGAETIVTSRSAAERLDGDAAAVRGVAFSHLHEDHVGGLAALCEAAGHTLPVYQRPLQADHTNYTTAKGADMIADAGCVEPVRVGGDGRLEGFPGLSLVSVGGHTPGSQILIAHVRDNHSDDGITTWVFTGDVVNHAAGIERNIPKPYYYSRFVIPESAEQLDRVRRWLAEAGEAGARLAVNHDLLQLEASGLPKR